MVVATKSCFSNSQREETHLLKNDLSAPLFCDLWNHFPNEFVVSVILSTT